MPQQGKSYIRTEAGPLIKTDNPLDVAVKGDAWMSFSTPQGQVYSRDGRMKMLSTGDPVSVTGNAILDVGGAPIVLQSGRWCAQDIERRRDLPEWCTGWGDRPYTIPADADLAYAGTSGVIPSKPAQPVVDDNSVGVVQGMIEGSNVDAMTEMTRLISISRAFEQVNNLLSQQEATVSEAIKTLGSKTDDA